MGTAKKRSRLSSVQRLERRLTSAITEKSKDKVVKFLDRLHRAGVHCGHAVEQAKRFLQTG